MSVTKDQITSEIQVVREETVSGANTKDRIARILDDINSIIEINTVSYTPQTLTSAQKLQALNNIGAASNIFNSTKDGRPTYNGNIMAMLSDVTTQGINETNGISVTNAQIDSNGDLIITLSDNTKINAGLTVGPKGEQGIQGNTGPQGPQGIPGKNGISIPLNLSISKQGANGTVYPQVYKWITDLTVSSVQLTSNCSDISVTINGTTYNATSLIGVTIPTGIELTINDLIIKAGYNSANAIIIFTQS
jgi:hypothetical protein